MGLHGKAPLLRLQSDERLIAFTRRGNQNAFEVLFSRYNSRLLAFCRHLLGSKEDAEDVLQEVMAAAFNAILADNRAINVRPWLYRIARNRSLNHLRRAHAIGVDSMDIHLSENGTTTADKVHERERFRTLVGDIQELPETQRTALVLREMDALSYEQIAEAMETTVPGVKSLLVRARIALAEAAEARQLSCEDVRLELGEVAEGIRKKPDALARRHLKSCTRCSTFQGQLKKTNKAIAAVLPLGPLAVLKKLALFHIGHSAGTGSGAAGTTAGATSAGATSAGATGAGATAGVTGAGATGAGAGAAGAGAAGATASAAGAGAAGAGAAGAGAAGATVVGSAGSAISAGAGALAGKAAAGLAAAAIVTAGAAVETSHSTHRRLQASAPIGATTTKSPADHIRHRDRAAAAKAKKAAKQRAKPAANAAAANPPAKTTATTQNSKTKPKAAADKTGAGTKTGTTTKTDPGRSQTQSDPTVLTSQPSGTSDSTSTPASGSSDPSSSSQSSSTTTTSPSTTPSPSQTSTGSNQSGSQSAGSSQYGSDPVSSGTDGGLVPASAPTG
jgi:RNA polymerase sigma factor (sigma-70 family)